MKTAMTVAKIGRSMKKWEKRKGSAPASVLGLGRELDLALLRLYRGAGAGAQETVDDDHVVLRQSIADDAQALVVGAGADHFRHDLALSVDRHDDLLRLVGDDGAVGDEE